MKYKKSYTVPLIIIVLTLIGALLRLWQLDSIPQELHRDEAAIGFNAYSLLQAGHDEYGQPWPLNFRSFGDYKLPGLIYTTIPFLHLFGVEVWSLRLPTTLFAILTIPLSYFFARALGLNNRTSLITTLLLTFSYWHISQARNAYEPMVGLFFSVLTLTAWLRGSTQKIWYLIAVITYSIGSFYYNVPWLYLPLAASALSIIKHGNKIHKEKTLMFSSIALLTAFILIGLIVFSTSATKSSVTVFNNADLKKTSEDYVYTSLVGGVPSRLARTIEQPNTFMVLAGVRGYLSAFNPEYVFSTGDENPWHNLRGIHLGNSNPALAVAVLTGLLVLIFGYQKKKNQYVGILLLISPIVSATTIDAPITNRLLDFHFILLLIAAIGVNALIERATHWKWRIPLILLIGVYLFFFLLFAVRYFFTYNLTLAPQWNSGVRSLNETIAQTHDQYSMIFLSGWDINYIYSAVYVPFSPRDFAQSSVRYVSGFDHVASFDKYIFDTFSFESIDSQLLYSHFNSQGPILIAVRGEELRLSQYQKAQKTAYDASIEWTMYEISPHDLLEIIRERGDDPEIQAQLEYLESCAQSCNKSLLEDFASTETQPN